MSGLSSSSSSRWRYTLSWACAAVLSAVLGAVLGGCYEKPCTGTGIAINSTLTCSESPHGVIEE